jgi:hypothetical protein
MRSSTVQKHEGQISNFYFLISTFRERLHLCKPHGLRLFETRNLKPETLNFHMNGGMSWRDIEDLYAGYAEGRI